MMPCIVLDTYQSFTGAYYLHLQEKRDIVMAQNTKFSCYFCVKLIYSYSSS